MNATKENECGACHQMFATDEEVFSHDCPGLQERAEKLRQEFNGKFVTRPSNFGIGTTTLPAPGAIRMPNGRPAGRSRGSVDVSGKITEKQSKFIRDLLAQRTGNESAEALRKLLNMLREKGELTSKVASVVITQLLEIRPNTNAPVVIESQENQGGGTRGGIQDLPDVPEGRYAVENEDGVLRFYSVDRPKDGRWAGRTFVAVWASDEKHPIRNPQERRKILEKIAEDPRAASVRFGQEIGKCPVCGRTLTDEESRANGIGPICKAKVGW